MGPTSACVATARYATRGRCACCCTHCTVCVCAAVGACAVALLTCKCTWDLLRCVALLCMAAQSQGQGAALAWAPPMGPSRACLSTPPPLPLGDGHVHAFAHAPAPAHTTVHAHTTPGLRCARADTCWRLLRGAGSAGQACGHHHCARSFWWGGLRYLTSPTCCRAVDGAPSGAVNHSVRVYALHVHAAASLVTRACTYAPRPHHAHHHKHSRIHMLVRKSVA